MDVTVSKWGNSVGVRIPAQIVKTYDIQSGDRLSCDIEENKMIFTFPKKEKVTVKSLFRNYHGDYKPTEVDWGKPVGREIW